MLLSALWDKSTDQSASQTFSITVQAVVTPPTSGAVRIREAEWDDSTLKVEGKVTPGRVMVTIINADTGQTLCTVRASREGEWKLEVRLPSVPCRVQAKVGDSSSAVAVVGNAPRSCKRATTSD